MTADFFPRRLTAGIVLAAAWVGSMPQPAHARSPQQWIEYFSGHWRDDGWGPPPHMRAADDDGWHARMRALQGLVTAGRPAVKPLLRVLEHGAPHQRMLKSETNRDVKMHIAYALDRKGSRIDAQVVDDLRNWDTDRIDSAQVGKVAPDFELPSLTGETIRLSDFRGKKPVVLVFIYGDT
jgi:hypothetical protein